MRSRGAFPSTRLINIGLRFLLTTTINHRYALLLSVSPFEYAISGSAGRHSNHRTDLHGLD